MKKQLLLGMLLLPLFITAQTGINTTNPQAILHVDGARDNPATGTPDPAQQANDFTISDVGRVGIGTIAPAAKLEITSGTTNTSGLRLTNLTSATPPSSGAPIGVNASGDIVTVPGISPEFGRAVLTTTANIPANTTNYNLMSFTLPSAGTYFITYSVRGEIQVTGGSGFLVSFLSSAPSAGNTITNTEILIITSSDSSRAVIGGTGTGTLVVTVAAPTTYYVGIKSSGLAGVVFNNVDGRTSASYVKVSP